MEQNKKEITFTYSGILTKENQKVVSVRFERIREGKKEFAEGILPKCDILKSEGFAEKEIEQLEVYLMENVDEIMKKAKEISKFKNLF